MADEKKSIVERLTEPIPKNLVMKKDVKNRDGKVLAKVDYIEWSTVVVRLNQVVGMGWDFEMRSYEDDGQEAIVFGRLCIGDSYRDDIGFEDNCKFWTTAGQRYKSAQSDCLKRCAAKFGIGLELYKDEGALSSTLAPEQSKEPAPQRNNGAVGGGDEELKKLRAEFTALANTASSTYELIDQDKLSSGIEWSKTATSDELGIQIGYWTQRLGYVSAIDEVLSLITLCNQRNTLTPNDYDSAWTQWNGFRNNLKLNELEFLDEPHELIEQWRVKAGPDPEDEPPDTSPEPQTSAPTLGHWYWDHGKDEGWPTTQEEEIGAPMFEYIMTHVKEVGGSKMHANQYLYKAWVADKPKEAKIDKLISAPTWILFDDEENERLGLIAWIDQKEEERMAKKK